MNSHNDPPDPVKEPSIDCLAAPDELSKKSENDAHHPILAASKDGVWVASSWESRLLVERLTDPRALLILAICGIAVLGAAQGAAVPCLGIAVLFALAAIAFFWRHE